MSEYKSEFGSKESKQDIESIVINNKLLANIIPLLIPVLFNSELVNQEKIEALGLIALLAMLYVTWLCCPEEKLLNQESTPKKDTEFEIKSRLYEDFDVAWYFIDCNQSLERKFLPPESIVRSKNRFENLDFKKMALEKLRFHSRLEFPHNPNLDSLILEEVFRFLPENKSITILDQNNKNYRLILKNEKFYLFSVYSHFDAGSGKFTEIEVLILNEFNNSMPGFSHDEIRQFLSSDTIDLVGYSGLKDLSKFEAEVLKEA